MNIRTGTLLALLLCTLCLCPPPAWGGPGRASGRTFSLPMAEAEWIISRWYSGSGCTVSRFFPGRDILLLEVEKERSTWQVTLKPLSPLKTEVLIAEPAGNRPGFPDAEKLWGFLEGYSSQETAPSRTGAFPDEILRRFEAVACIEGGAGKGTFQLTGFFIDGSGTVLATAHDLNPGDAVTVTSQRAGKGRGSVARIDRGRDLAVIRTDLRNDAFMAVSGTNFVLGAGERIYALGCSQSGMAAPRSGFVNGTLRLAGDMPLWEASLLVQPGSSGSPVLDAGGNLVAVIKGRYRGTESVGFLIPIWVVLEFLGR